MVDLSPYLSDRELEVVDLLSLGKNNFEIARGLGISPKTIDTHLSRIFARLNVKSRLELMLVALGTLPISAKARRIEAKSLYSLSELNARRLKLMIAQYQAIGWMPYQIAETLCITEGRVRRIQYELNHFCKTMRQQTKAV